MVSKEERKFFSTIVKNGTIALYKKLNGEEYVLEPGFYFVNGFITRYDMKPEEKQYEGICITNRFGQKIVFDVSVVSQIAGGMKPTDYYGTKYCDMYKNRRLSNSDATLWWRENHPLKKYIENEKQFMLDDEYKSPINKPGLTRTALESSFMSFYELDFEDIKKLKAEENLTFDSVYIQDAYIGVRKMLFDKGRQLTELKINNIGIYQNGKLNTINLDIDIDDKKFDEDYEMKNKVYTKVTRKGDNTIIKVNKNSKKLDDDFDEELSKNRFIIDYDLLDDNTPSDKKAIVNENTEYIKSRMGITNTNKVAAEEEELDENGYATINSARLLSEEVIAENRRTFEERNKALREQEKEEIIEPINNEETLVSEKEVITNLANEYGLSLEELFEQLDKIKELRIEGLDIDKLKQEITDKTEEIEKLKNRLNVKRKLVKNYKFVGIKGLNEVSEEYEEEIKDLVAEHNKTLDELKLEQQNKIAELTAEYDKKIAELNDIINGLNEKLDKVTRKEENKNRIAVIPLFRKIRDGKSSKEITGVNTALLNKYKDEELNEPINTPANMIAATRASFNDEIADLKKKVTEKDQLIESLNNTISDKEAMVNDLQERIIEKEGIIENKDREINRANMLNEELDNKREALLKEKESLEDTKQFLNNEIASAKENLSKKDEEILGLEKELSEKANEISLLKTENENLVNSAKEHTEKEKTTNESIDQKDEKINELEKELTNKTNEIEELKTKNVELNDKNINLTELNNNLAVVNEELVNSKTELRNTNDELTYTNLELIKANEELTKTNEELTASNEELTKTNEELKTRKEIPNLKTDDIAIERVVLVKHNGETKKYKINLNGNLSYNGSYREKDVINNMIYSKLRAQLATGEMTILDYDYGNTAKLFRSNNRYVRNKTNIRKRG